MRLVSVVLNGVSILLLALSAALIPVATVEAASSLFRFPATVIDPLGALKARLSDLSGFVPFVASVPDRYLAPLYLGLMIIGLILIYRTRVGLAVGRLQRLYEVKLKEIEPYAPPGIGDRLGLVYGTQYFGLGLGTLLTPLVGPLGILAGSLAGVAMAAVMGKETEKEDAAAHARQQQEALEGELQAGITHALGSLRRQETIKVALACGLAALLLSIGMWK